MKNNSLFVLVALLLCTTISLAQNQFTELRNEQQIPSVDQDIPGRQVITADLEVIGSLGVGFDSSDGQAYGFDTVILRENNLRIFFDDTSSSASFPGNDWRLTANDSNNGGGNYFSIDDATANTRPFRVDAGAGNNAFRIEAGGNVGLGIDNPVVELHIADGDTATLRLNQDNSGGFSPYSWDLAGNETNFFIRDVNGGSALPFRIAPGSGTDDALMIKNNGSIGIKPTGGGFGGINPNASIDLDETNKGLQLNRLTNAQRTALGTALGAGEVGVVVFDTEDGVLYTWDGTAWIQGSDNQQLTLNVNSLDLENGGSVDLSPYLDNTDDQVADVFQLNGSDLELSLEDDGVATNTVDLSSLLDNTDDQVADVFQLNGTDLELSLEDDGVATNIADLSSLLDNTDDQVADVFQLNGTDLELSLEDDGVATNIADLSSLLDNTDDQVADIFQLNGTDLELSLEDDGVATNIADLSSLLDNTDDQVADVFQLNGTNLELSLENDGVANNVADLSSLLDNTDNQNISGSGLAGNILTIGITGGTSEDVDLSALNDSGTDDQQLTLAGNALNLEDGGSVDLTPFLDNTDDQNLGNFVLNGPFLSLAIQRGNLVSVDMSPLLSDLEAENAAQQSQINNLISQNTAQQALIDDLIARVEALEDCACTLDTEDFGVTSTAASLFQNVPNPFNNSTSIEYFIPLDHSRANIVISTVTGQILQNIPITKFGKGEISVSKERMSSAIYFYTLFVDGKKVDSKRMVVE